METKVAVPPPVRAAFSGLIDYAGLFPPAKLALDDALAEYRRAQRSAQAWMLGRFIIPWSLLGESSLTQDIRLSVIVEGRREALAAIRRVAETGARIEAAEIPPGDGLDYETICALGIPAFVEISRSRDWNAKVAREIDTLAGAGLRAKLRCGGVTIDAFPSVADVTEFIVAATKAKVPFKATAGLHHPVRHVDAATGFPMHGFLNLLAAAALAPRLTGRELQRVVAEEDPEAFRFDESAFYWREEVVPIAALQACRASAFVGYGSCSFSEPVDDLKALGMLPA